LNTGNTSLVTVVDNLLQIICGAPNAREGARVPVAKIGSKLAIKDPKNKEM
jgi:tRNA-binding EMAP/Myf-like protein